MVVVVVVVEVVEVIMVVALVVVILSPVTATEEFAADEKTLAVAKPIQHNDMIMADAMLLLDP